MKKQYKVGDIVQLGGGKAGIIRKLEVGTALYQVEVIAETSGLTLYLNCDQLDQIGDITNGSSEQVEAEFHRHLQVHRLTHEQDLARVEASLGSLWSRDAVHERKLRTIRGLVKGAGVIGGMVLMTSIWSLVA